jgi:hypothetical protein
VFGPPTKEPATATIHYRVGKKECPLTWRDEATSPALSAVSYFDSDCATIYVASANDIAFTPFGLDLFEKLAGACRALKESLDRDQQNLQKQQPACLKQPPVGAGTKVAEAIKTLSATSDVDAFKTLAALSEEERRRLDELKAIEAQDPAKLLSGVQVSRTRLLQLKGIVASLVAPQSADATKRSAQGP